MASLSVNGRVWVFGDGLTTDDMYPPDAMKLDLPEAAKMVFYNVRPDWTAQVEAGDIVVAGRNFGLGSSRPVAALFNQLGVSALIAEEFNSLFFRNAVNAGLPAMTVPGATSSFTDGDQATLDLRTGEWRNDTTGRAGTVPVLPDLVLEIVASGGILPRLAEQGYVDPGLAELLRSPSVAAAGQGSGA
ncbi:LeuD/DmdB family oxidoreductase small subunit [Nocardioides luteus]|uniref:LeuD/DmdB family oxidoreductase small subunit n=1 Tax=Nocardioides luteus TaxID=1844 RepID=UPI0018CA81C3|nr:3-isopropylmalate dehydratase [Nocardioides luteus]MBG6095844.1 3-isopropylmalate/(R)-2-methylmalate dehydratase small subunit [Nocardioides luteus]